MRTPLCDVVGVEFPIFAFTHCRDVAAAVSRAGGLGVLGIGASTPEQLEIELGWLDATVGDAPYGVDVLIPGKAADVGVGPNVDDRLPEEHRRFVSELLARYDVPPMPGPVAAPTLGGVADQSVSLVNLALGHPIRPPTAGARRRRPRS
jgi:NAD(P)H-dependent flavin oxidoreductase YrpB (nitropropane dioxygenase family)